MLLFFGTGAIAALTLALQPCCYYYLWEIKLTGVQVAWAASGVMVLDLNMTIRQTDRQTRLTFLSAQHVRFSDVFVTLMILHDLNCCAENLVLMKESQLDDASSLSPYRAARVQFIGLRNFP